MADGNGKPLVVYHATDSNFSKFDFGRLGELTSQNTDASEALVMAGAGTLIRVHDTVPAGHSILAQGYIDRDGTINLVAENLTAQTARPVLLHVLSFDGWPAR